MKEIKKNTNLYINASKYCFYVKIIKLFIFLTRSISRFISIEQFFQFNKIFQILNILVNILYMMRRQNASKTKTKNLEKKKLKTLERIKESNSSLFNFFLWNLYHILLER